MIEPSIITNKSFIDVYLKNINFLISYTILFVSLLYLHRRENRFINLGFAIFSIPVLALIFDSINDFYFLIPLRSIDTFSAYLIVLIPIYLVYFGFLNRFKNNLLLALSCLLLGATSELLIIFLGFNIPTIIRYIWVLVFVLMNLPLRKRS